MKTISSIAGVRKIEDHDPTLIPVHLRDILVEIRSALIARMNNMLSAYIFYKFIYKATPSELSKCRVALETLRMSPIEIDNEVLKMVMANDESYIETAYFYTAIDHAISSCLDIASPKPWETLKVSGPDLAATLRFEVIDNILTDKGLIDFAAEHYGADLSDMAKLHYLHDEIREYLVKTPVDYPGYLKMINDNKGDFDMHEYIEYLFVKEMKAILNPHFQ